MRFYLSGNILLLICFFCYCAIEQTTGLWAGSYLNLHNGISAETAAGFASMFYLGITVGRAISGFITMRLSDLAMIRLGQGIILVGNLGMPPLFGIIANRISVSFLPLYLCVILILMVVMHEALNKVTEENYENISDRI